MENYFGIDVGGTFVKWARLDGNLHVLKRGSVPTNFSNASEVVDTLVNLAKEQGAGVAGMGVSVPGGVYEGDDDGTVHRGGSLTYMDGCPLGKLLRDALRVPVAVNNDGKCCALGEYAAGALRGTKVGVVLAIGTGIGGGIVIDGKVLRGAHCFAGEMSFLRNDVLRPMSEDNCFGFTGSWRSLANAVIVRKGLPADAQVDGKQVFDWIEKGDEAARQGLDDYALRFDAQLVNLQAVIDPEVFVISGGVSRRPQLIEAMRAQMPKALLGYEGGLSGIPVPQVKRAELGNDANLYGAVSEVMRLVG